MSQEEWGNGVIGTSTLRGEEGIGVEGEECDGEVVIGEGGEDEMGVELSDGEGRGLMCSVSLKAGEVGVE